MSKVSDDSIKKALKAAGEKMAEVVKLHPVTVGDGFRFEPDNILEAAKGQDFITVAVLAQREDGSIWISGNANAGETLVLMERAKRVVVFGEES